MKIDTVKECIDYLDEVGELNRIKAQAIADAVNAHPFQVAYIEHTGQTRTNGTRCEIWLSSTDLMFYANKLRGEK